MVIFTLGLCCMLTDPIKIEEYSKMKITSYQLVLYPTHVFVLCKRGMSYQVQAH